MQRLDVDRIEALARRAPLDFEVVHGIWRSGDAFYVPPFYVSWFARSGASISYVSGAYVMRVGTVYGWIQMTAPSIHDLFRRLADMAIVADAAVRDVYHGVDPDDDLFLFAHSVILCVSRGERPARVVCSDDGDERYRVGDFLDGAPAARYADSLRWYALSLVLASIVRGWDDRADLCVV